MDGGHAWQAQVPGRIAVVAACYEKTADPLAAWCDCFRLEDVSAFYLIVPQSLLQQRPAAVRTLPGLRVQSIRSDELEVAQGCLCCDLRSELGSLLGQLFMRLLARREARVSTVFVVTRAMQVSALVQMLEHAPFLAQRYAFGGRMDLDAQPAGQ